MDDLYWFGVWITIVVYIVSFGYLIWMISKLKPPKVIEAIPIQSVMEASG